VAINTSINASNDIINYFEKISNYIVDEMTTSIPFKGMIGNDLMST
jgi:hypothetical protein